MLTGEGEEVRGAELSGRTADELTRAAVKASEWTDDAAKAGLVADDGLNVPGRVAEDDAA